MVSKGADQVVLWPHFFDVKRSRQAGRRVPSDLAVEKPDASWVASAAKKLGLKPEKEEKAKHSSKPWDACGRVLVDRKGTKEETIRLVAKQMKA